MMLSKLRPQKVRGALRRRWFERRLNAFGLDGQRELLALGSDYGGWLLPDGVLGAGEVCYCVGAGADVSFDLELIRRFGVVVRAFEPVPEYVSLAQERMGAEPSFSCRQVAITPQDGPVRMQVHHHAGSASLSAAGLYDTNDWIECSGRTIPSLMRELGDEQIRLLKLDVEGAEYELLPTLDLAGLGVTIFCVQLHHSGSVAQARTLIDAVRAQGFALVGRRPVVKLTFLRASSGTA